MKINAEQQRLLDAVTAADTNYRDERTAAYERAKKVADEQVEAARIRRDIAAYYAAEGGVPITGASGMAQREVGLHTTAAKTVYDAVENGRRYAIAPATAAAVVSAAGIEYDPATGIVVVDGVRFTVETNLAGKKILELVESTDATRVTAQSIYASGRDRDALAWLAETYPEQEAAA